MAADVSVNSVQVTDHRTRDYIRGGRVGWCVWCGAGGGKGDYQTAVGKSDRQFCD